MRRSLILLCVLGVVPNAAQAQRADSASVAPLAATPACCSIVRIETPKSLVTARETATGFTFRFTVKNRRVLTTLKIGQPVWADFAAKTVKLKATDTTACCGIVETPPTQDTDSLGSAPRVAPNDDNL